MVNEIDKTNANKKLVQAIDAGLRVEENIGLYSQNAMNLLKESLSGKNPLIDINIKNETDANALHGMASLGAPDTFKAFIEAGLDVNSVDNHDNTPLHMLTYTMVARDPEAAANILKAALDKGADVTLENKAGTSVLEHLNDLKIMLDFKIKSEFKLANGDPEKTAAVVKLSEEFGKFTKEIPEPVLVKPKANEKERDEINEKHSIPLETVGVSIQDTANEAFAGASSGISNTQKPPTDLHV